MPSLPTLLINADGSSPRNWSAQDFANIDEGISSADGSIISPPNDTNNVVTCFLWQDLPADARAVTSMSVNVRYKLANTRPASPDTYGLGVRIRNGATILAANTNVGAYQSIVSASNISNSFTNSGAIAFAYINTAASASTWNAAQLDIVQTYTQSGAADSNHIDVDTLELTGVYQEVISITLSGNSSLSTNRLGGRVPITNTLAGNSSLSCSISGKGKIATTLSGNSSLSGSISGRGGVAVSLSGNTSLSCSIQGRASISNSFSGNSSLSANIQGLANAQCTLSGSTSLSLGLGGKASISCSSSGSSNLTAALSAYGEIAVSLSGSTSLAASLGGIGGLSCSLAGSTTLAASFEPPSALVVALGGSTSLSASLGGIGSLACALAGSTLLSMDAGGGNPQFALSLFGSTTITSSLGNTSLGYITRLMRTIHAYFKNTIEPALSIPVVYDNRDLQHDEDLGVHVTLFAETQSTEILETSPVLKVRHLGIITVVVATPINKGRKTALQNLDICVKLLREKTIAKYVSVATRDLNFDKDSDDVWYYLRCEVVFESFDIRAPVTSSTDSEWNGLTTDTYEVASVISDRLEDNIETPLGILVGYDNRSIDPDADDIFAVLNIEESLSSSAEFGPLFRRSGIAEVLIGVPQNSGTSELWAICDAIYDTYLATSQNGVNFYAPTFERVGVLGAWWQTIARCPFYVDSLEV